MNTLTWIGLLTLVCIGAPFLIWMMLERMKKMRKKMKTQEDDLFRRR
jgi:hypothetical protein